MGLLSEIWPVKTSQLWRRPSTFCRATINKYHCACCIQSVHNTIHQKTFSLLRPAATCPSQTGSALSDSLCCTHWIPDTNLYNSLHNYEDGEVSCVILTNISQMNLAIAIDRWSCHPLHMHAPTCTPTASYSAVNALYWSQHRYTFKSRSEHHRNARWEPH